MITQQTKQKLNQYLTDFQAENNAFQKVVIIKDYLDYLDNLEGIGSLFADSKNTIMRLFLGVVEETHKATGKEKELEANIPVTKIDKDTPVKNIVEKLGFAKNLGLGLQDNIFNKDEVLKMHYMSLSMISRPLELYKIVEEESRKKLENSFETNFKNPQVITTVISTMTSLTTEILDRLNKSSFLSPATKEQNNQISFNSQISTLIFKGEDIKISRKNDLTKDHYILEYLFSQDDLKDEAYYKDIAEEKLCEDYNLETDFNKYYKACQRLQDKIRTSTKNKIDDFLIFNSGKTAHVKINPKYIQSCLKNKVSNADE